MPDESEVESLPRSPLARYGGAERRALALAILDRAHRRRDGLEALQQAYPSAPSAMVQTAAHHLFGDGPEAAVDFLAAAELLIRDPRSGLDGGATVHLAYHLYNWLQFRAILPEGRQDLLDLVAQLRQAVDENDMEFVKGTLEELEDVVGGHRSAPDVMPP